MAGQLFKVWFHGPLLPQPTKVAVSSTDWDVDDLKKALIAKAPMLRAIGAPSLIVTCAKHVAHNVYISTGDGLPVDRALHLFGDMFSMNSHFFVESAPAAEVVAPSAVANFASLVASSVTANPASLALAGTAPVSSQSAAVHGDRLVVFAAESSDAVLVNYGPPEAARPDVDLGAEILELVACVKELILSNKEVLRKHSHEDASFSGMSQTRLLRLLQARMLQQGQAVLPQCVTLQCMRVVRAHVWKHKSEVAESESLLQHLQLEVRASVGGLSALDNVFMDVQHLGSSEPVTATIEDGVGELTIRGVPDCAILDHGVDDTVLSPFANACAVIDWKTSARVSKSDAQIMTQAVVLAGEGASGPPAFVTDLSKGFRCWIVVDSILFRFHPADTPGPPRVSGFLTLSEGVALIRYFIENHGRMAAVDRDALLHSRRGGGTVSGSAGGGSSMGGGGASGYRAPPSRGDDSAGAGQSPTPPAESGAGAGRLEPPPASATAARGSHTSRRGAFVAVDDLSSGTIYASENAKEGAGEEGEAAERHVNGSILGSPHDVMGDEDSDTGCRFGAGSGESRATRPLSKAEAAAYQAVALEEFALQARAVQEIIELHQSHAPN